MKWIENTFIFVAHIVLLYWILHILQYAGLYSMKHQSYHFLGIAIYGGLLIFSSAKIIKRRTLIEHKLE